MNFSNDSKMNSKKNKAMVSTSDLSNKQFLFQNLLLTTLDSILKTKSGEIKVSLKYLPYFNGHVFQDMIVLPGSALTEIALLIYYNIYNIFPHLIININFGSLIILSDEDIILRFDVSEISHSRKKIEFVVQNNDNLNDKSFLTTLEIEDIDFSIDKLNKKKMDFDEYINNSDSSLLSDDFYRKLSSNGNQYGLYFKNIKQIWIKGNEALCKLDFSSINYPSEKQFLLNPIKIDSFTQLLSVLSKEEGKTFILISISEIHILNSDLAEHMWCCGKLSPQKNGSKNEFEGELKVFNNDGTLCIELFGVKFKYLNRFQQKEESEDLFKNKFFISSTFTTEPIEDTLKFWNNFFNFPYDIQFIPYNQVFQELLNPHSLLSSNENGFNVILLGLEDWTRREHKLVPIVSQEKLDTVFNNKFRFTLPNQLEIVQLNKYETEYVYKEIFVDKCYLKHGITINDGDTIIDIGANIGLFTLFVNQHCKEPVVYSFEPSPAVYDILKANCKVYGSKVKTFNYGVSDKAKSKIFTFYEKSSVFSSFNPNETEDKKTIQAVVRNLLKDASVSDSDSLEEYVEELTNGRLESKSYECQLLSVSDIIKENSIDKIDLLKIDAEKSELDIIRGIEDKDWQRIKQVVIEIHDKSRKMLEEIESILKSKGFSVAVEEEKMLQESGLFNIFANKYTSDENLKPGNGQIRFIEARLIENIENFLNSLNSFIQKTTVPLIVAITPRSSTLSSQRALSSLYGKYEVELLERINKLPNVFTISSFSLLTEYPVQDYYDSQGDDLGHIPYTLPFFTSIGTTLFRLIFSLRNSPYKVIALDCDNTLWKGVCGEDGPKGIQISDNYKFLQQLLIDQIQAGKLVCLCSKNNEEDIWEVFRLRDDMLLKTEHLVSWRINWDYKSVNLISLAEELNLGLDSFIFIDDNPLECAEVKANCPEVLTLQLPQAENKIPGFLKNTWAFDHLKVTEEDKKRTNMYKENIKREKYFSTSLTLKDFLDGLNLKVKISNPKAEQINRVSQLTFRTNQFNFSTRRRSEPEIREFLAHKDNSCLIAEVSDRFGDYGLVGVLFCTEEESCFKVDTFLLSCRVLGRGVEFQILSELGKKAIENGTEFIEIKYIPSPKNRPALDFIEKIGSQFKIKNADQLIIRLPAEYLVNLNYEIFLEQDFSSPKEDKKDQVIKSGIKEGKRYSDYSEKLQKIADEFKDAESIYNKVEEFKIGQESERENILMPETDLEKEMTLVWQRVLSRTNLSMDDNFLEIGGNSLKAVQLIASIKKDLNINISIVDIFECPTIELLARKVNSKNDNKSFSVNSESVSERGSRRRNLRISRKSGDK